MISILFSILCILVIFGVLIIVHELGHFIAAKKIGVRVTEFSFGLGPKLWSKEYNDTEYSIRAIPFGGYIKPVGEDEEGEIDPSDKGNFQNRSFLERMIIIFSGPLMNFVLAVFILTCIGMFFGVEKFEGAKVISVLQNSAAEKAGLKKNDIIFEINQQKLANFQEMFSQIRANAGKNISLGIIRDKEKITLSAVPDPITKQLGFQSSPWSKITGLKVTSIKKGTLWDNSGLKPKDLIIGINGNVIDNDNFKEAIWNTDNKPLTLEVKRNNETATVQIPPTGSGIDFSFILRGFKISQLENKSVWKKAGFEKDDVIVSADNKEIKSLIQLQQQIILENSANKKEVTFKVKRKKNDLELKVVPDREGIAFVAESLITVTSASEAWEKIGLKKDDILASINNKKPENKEDLRFLIQDGMMAPNKMNIKIIRGSDTITIKTSFPALGLAWKTEGTFHKLGLVAAVGKGFEQTYSLVYQTCQFLYGAATQKQSIKGVAGPVGIMRLIYIVSGDFLTLLQITAFLNIAIGFFNLLPFPALDGGRLVFLLIGSITRKTVDQRVEGTIHYLGFALLMILAVLITYRDIWKWVTGRSLLE